MAERLLAAFESLQAHRHQLELETVRHGIWRSKYGLWCGLAVALGALMIAGAAIAKDQQVAGAVIGGGTLVGVVTLFVTRQHGQRKEREGVCENSPEKSSRIFDGKSAGPARHCLPTPHRPQRSSGEIRTSTPGDHAACSAIPPHPLLPTTIPVSVCSVRCSITGQIL